MRRQIIFATAVVSAIACAAHTANATYRARSPQSALDELLRADRAFSAASMKTDLVTGISAMFAPDVATPVPGARFSKTAAEATDAMRAVKGSTESHAEWTPVRGGISADGTQGFTLGYMIVHAADGTTTPMKYLSYWVKGPQGWRVAAYRRRPRAASDVALTMRGVLLPSAMVAPSHDEKRTSDFRASLDHAERSFSDDAQRIGLADAFTKWGTVDSYNMGAMANSEFVVGGESIGKVVATGEPATGSSVNWAPDRVVIASSGDLGVTIGTIHVKNPPADGSQNAGFPFFTVWRRASADSPWHYIAE